MTEAQWGNREEAGQILSLVSAENRQGVWAVLAKLMASCVAAEREALVERFGKLATEHIDDSKAEMLAVDGAHHRGMAEAYSNAVKIIEARMRAEQ